MLIHAMQRWPEVTTQYLWLCVVSLEVFVRKRCEIDKNGLFPLDNLSTVKHLLNLQNSHVFGCPCCWLSILRADRHLRVEIKISDDVLILKQLRLIERTIELLGLIDANPRYVLVLNPLLGKNAEGKDREGDSFHHRSKIGLLKFLAGCTRPNISMDDNQVDVFSTNPKTCHDSVVKRIVKHLLGTRNEGLMRTSNEDESLEAFVDNDFSGRFNTITAKDMASTYSREGFFIECASYKIICKSKLQTEIALSTIESEHIKLLKDLRGTTPTIHLPKEISAMMDVPTCDKL